MRPTRRREETLVRLRRLGFANPEAAAAVLGRWKNEPYAVVRDPRSRDFLDTLTPALLTAMLGTVDPDLALERFDHLLSCLPDGLQMFALFQANLHVMENVAEMMICAPAIAERLAERPALFQALIESEADPVVPDRTALEEDLDRQLESAGNEADTLSRLRIWVEATELRILAHTLFRRLDPLDEPLLPQGNDRLCAPGDPGPQRDGIAHGARTHRRSAARAPRRRPAGHPQCVDRFGPGPRAGP